ncbi:MAG: alpha/beta hydrolase [bacterium]
MASAEMQAFLDAMGYKPNGADKGSIEVQRRELEAFMSTFDVPANVQELPCILAGRPASRFVPPQCDRRRATLYLHGGGYSVGSITGWRSFLAHLALSTGSMVIGLDYRLAPEHIFPAALDDTVAAYLELLNEFEHDKLMIAGDSAGGGLALSTLLALQDQRVALPGCATLLSPATDLSGTGKPKGQEKDDYISTARLYAGDYPLDTVGLSPIFGDFHALPPVLVQVAKDEFMYDESARFARQAQQAGVQVNLHVYEGAFHVFQLFTFIPEAQQALAEMGAFFKEHT